MTIALTNSSAPKMVLRLPVMNLPNGMSRVAPRRCTRTLASRASSAGTPSAAGDALQTLPTSVPRFCTCGPPTSTAALRTPSNQPPSLLATASLQVTRAPIVTVCWSTSIWSKPSTFEMSNTGRADSTLSDTSPQPRRCASAGYRSVPPASTVCGASARRRKASSNATGP